MTEGMTSISNALEAPSNGATAIAVPESENAKALGSEVLKEVNESQTNELKDLGNELAKEEVTEEKPKAENKPKTTSQKIYESIDKLLGQKSINWVLGIGDFLSFATDWINIPFISKHKELIDKYSVDGTKGVIMARFLNAGWGAFMKNRVAEAFGRIGGIIALPFVKLEDITLATGLSTYFTQSDIGIEGVLGKDKEWGSKLENVKDWFGAYWKLTKDIFSQKTWFGKGRKLFPDLSMDYMKEVVKTISKDFFVPGQKLRQSESDEGHTAIFGAYFIGLGALLGVLFGRKTRGIANKVFGVMRNLGGIMGDYTLLTHPDDNMRKAGVFTGLASVVDIVQRFLPKKIINSINHLNMINNMIGLNYYSDRTKKKTDKDITTYAGDAKISS